MMQEKTSGSMDKVTLSTNIRAENPSPAEVVEVVLTDLVRLERQSRGRDRGITKLGGESSRVYTGR